MTARHARLNRLGVTLRPETPDDADLVRRVYHDGRADEVAAAGWPDAMARRFLDEQFRLQSHHYAAHHSSADRSIIEVRPRRGADPVPVGRLYIDRTTAMWKLLEIGLLATARGAGVGAALIEALQREAVAARVQGIALTVLHSNERAGALYARLGFADTASLTPTHRAMCWRPKIS